jgi:hypothetical protein
MLVERKGIVMEARNYKIPESRLEELRNGLQSINKRAAKLGVQPVEFDVGEYEIVEVKVKGSQKPRLVKYFHVTIIGETPRIGGWEFCAAIDHTYGVDAGNIIKSVPGIKVPAKYRSLEAVCEHCGKNRKRNKTYLLRSDDEWKQVGSTCLKDFVGSAARDPNSLAAYCELLVRWLEGVELSERDDDGYGFGSGFVYDNLDRVLAITVLVIKDNGWVSRQTAKDSFSPVAATSDIVAGLLYGKEEVEISDEAWAKARAAIAWGVEIAEDVDSNYLHNVRVLCRAGVVGFRELGLAASIIQAFDRAQEKERKRARPESNWFGTVDKREVFRLKVVGVSYSDGYYGLTTIVRFEDEAGNDAIWFSSSTPHCASIEQVDGVDALVNHEIEHADDDVLYVRATVKEHGQYHGRKQTVLSRCIVTKYDASSKAVKKYVKELASVAY